MNIDLVSEVCNVVRTGGGVWQSVCLVGQSRVRVQLLGGSVADRWLLHWLITRTYCTDRSHLRTASSIHQYGLSVEAIGVGTGGPRPPDFFVWGAQYDRGPRFWKMPPHLWVKSNALFSELRSVSTTRVDGPSWWVSKNAPEFSGRQLGQWTRAVNSGSGNRPLISF